MNSSTEIPENNFISSTSAAEITGYSQDYIGQLCRAKKIIAEKAGKNWYVDSASILEYKRLADLEKEKTLQEYAEIRRKSGLVNHHYVPRGTRVLSSVRSIAAITAVIAVVAVSAVYALNPQGSMGSLVNKGASQVASIGDIFSAVGTFFGNLFGGDAPDEPEPTEYAYYPYQPSGTSPQVAAQTQTQTPTSTVTAPAPAPIMTPISAPAPAPAPEPKSSTMPLRSSVPLITFAEVDARIEAALASFSQWQPTYTFISTQSSSDAQTSGHAISQTTSSLITGGSANFNGSTLTVTGNATIGGNASVGGSLTVNGGAFSVALGVPINLNVGSNLLLSVNDSGVMVATTTPSVAAIFATSTTATSTFAGSVGIGTTSPRFALDINGVIGLNSVQFGRILNSGNTTGNITVGDGGTLLANTTSIEGSHNTFVGLGAGTSTTRGFQNTFVGYQAGQANTTGLNNTFIGIQAGFRNTTGSSNTYVGILSGSNHATGTDNVFLGQQTGAALVSGSSNTFIGQQAAQIGVTGSFNTFLGRQAGRVNTADNGTMLGYLAGTANTTGANNIFIGYKAGDEVVTGSNNIIIGYDIDATSTTATRGLNIGNLIFGTGLDGTGTTLATGNIGIGTSTPADKFSVNGRLLVNGTTTISAADAGITFTGSGVHDITAVQGTLRIGSNTIIGNIQAVDETVDIGTPAVRFDKIYATEINATTLVGNIAGGNVTPETLTINSDNVSADTENSYLSFERGTTIPNALLTWNADEAAKRFEFNQPLFIQNASASTTLTTFDIKGVASQTADLLRIQNSAGTNLLNLSAGGNLGIGTTSPYAKLSVVGEIVSANFTATSTTATSTINGALGINPSGINGTGGTAATRLEVGGALAAGTVGTQDIFTLSRGFSNGVSHANWASFALGRYSNADFNANTRLDIKLNNSGDSALSGASAVMTLQGNGNVGIGTTTPSSRLSLSNSVADSTVAPILILNTAYGGFGSIPTIDFTINGTVDTSQVARIGAKVDTTSGGNLILYTTANYGTSQAIERMRINGSGNVGIGTTSPFAKLSVAGSSNGTGAVFAISTSTAAATSTAFIVDANGNVGIGTGIPSALFNVGYAGQDLFRLDNTSDGRMVLDATGPHGQQLVFTPRNSSVGNKATVVTNNTFELQASEMYLGDSTDTTLRIVQSTDEIMLHTGGGEKVRLNSAGKLGIGTTTPFSTLSVNTTAGTSPFSIGSSTSSYLYMDKSGNTGLGITNPLSLLHIKGSNPFITLEHNVSDQGEFGIKFLDHQDPTYRASKTAIIARGGNNSYARADLLLAVSTSTATTEVTTADTKLGISALTGNVGIGIGSTNASARLQVFDMTDSAGTIDMLRIGAGHDTIGDVAGITFSTRAFYDNRIKTAIYAIQNRTSSYGQGDLAFALLDDGGVLNGNNVTTADEKIRITSTGRFGIGTSSPYARLSVHGNTSGTYTGTLFSVASSTASATTTHFAITAGGNVGIGTTSPYTSLAVAGASGVLANIFTATSTTATSTFSGGATFATGGGNVGVGTLSPSDKFSVVGGNISTDGKIRFSLNSDNNSIFRDGATGSTVIQTPVDMILRLGNGNVLMTLKNGGNVGIGTTTPWGQLSVNPNGITGPSFTIGSSTRTDFIVTNGGRVGIGTTNPFSKLTIALSQASPALADVSNTSGITLAGASNGRLQFGMDSFSNGWIQSGYDNGGGSNGTTFLSLNPLGGNVGVGTTSPTTLFAVTGGTGTYITSGGKVGIGNSAPQYALDVTSNSSGYGAIRINNPNTGSSASSNINFGGDLVLLQLNSSGNSDYGGEGSFNIINNNGVTTFVTGGTEKMRLSGANLGIGTTTLSQRLSVQGNGLFSGNISAANLTATGTLTVAGATTLNGTLAVTTNAVSTIGADLYVGYLGDGNSTFQIGPATPTTNGGAKIKLHYSNAVRNWQIGANQTLSGALEFTPSTANGGTTFTTAAMLISPAGNVGIGTTSPSGTLSVNIGSTTPAMFVGALGSSTPSFYIGSANSNGHVGIGTTTPMGKLAVVGTLLNVQDRTYPPQFVGSSTVAAAPLDIHVVGKYAYLPRSSNLEIWDVSSSTPALVSSTGSLPIGGSGAVISGRYMYGLGGSGIQAIDISNPARPVAVGTGAGASQVGGPRDIYLAGKYVFLHGYPNVVEMYDISNPLAIKLGGRWTGATGDISHMAVSGNYAYLSNGTILDISNPGNIVQVGSGFSVTSSTHVYVQGKFLYVIGQPITIFDISNPESPTQVGTIPSGPSYNSEAVISGNYIYFKADYFVNPPRVYTYDISNPRSPREVNRFDLFLQSGGGTGHAFNVVGKRMYTMEGSDYLQFTIRDIGGVEANSVLAHSFEAGKASILGNTNIGGSLTIGEALTVGRMGIVSQGAIGVHLASTTSTTSPSLLSIYSQGNIGIGTTSPWANLAINPVAGYAANQFVIGSSTRTTFVVDNSGNIGIGTANPLTKLQIGSKVSDDSNYTYDSGALMVVNQTPTSATVLNDPRTALFLARQGTGGQAYGAAAAFNLSRYENNGVASRTRLDIDLAHGAFLTSSTTVLTLLSSGNIGLGTTTPGSKLTITGAGDTSGVQDIITLARGSNQNGAAAYIGFNRYLDGTPYGRIGFLNEGASPTIGGAFVVQTGTSATLAERLRVDSTGNVGIGTTSPYTSLAVAGASGVLANRFTATSTTATSTFSGGATFAVGGGNVGIGTLTPGGKLEVNGDILLSATAATSTLGIRSNVSNVNGSDLIVQAGTPASGTSVHGGDLILKGGNAFAGDGVHFGGDVQIYGGGNGAAANYYGKIKLFIGNTPTETFTVQSGGVLAMAPMTASTYFGAGTAVVGGNSTLGYAPLGSVEAYGNVGVILSINSSGQRMTGNSVGGAINFYGLTDSATELGAAIQMYNEDNNLWGASGITGNASLIFKTRTLAGTAPTEALRISSNGRLGIGTSSPYARLSVHGDTSSTYTGTLFSVASSTASATTTHFAVTAGGNVGIGTTSPSAKLAVTGSGTGTGRLFSLANSSNIERFTVLDNGTLNIAGVINASSTANFASTINITNVNANEGIQASASGSQLWAVTRGSGNDLALTGRGGIGFSANESAGPSTSYDMYLTTGGSLGVGTTTPISLLNVAGATAPKITITDTDASANQKHWFIESNSGKFGIGTTSDALLTNSAFRALTIDTGGNVGIGKNVPVGRLSITDAIGSAIIAPSSSADDLVIENSEYMGISLLTSNARGSFINFGDTEDNDVGSITYLHDTGGNYMSFTTNAAEQLRITGTGNVGIGTTSPAMNLSVQGNGLFSGNISAANLTATGTATFGGNVTSSGTISSPGAGNVSERFGALSAAAGGNSVAVGNAASAAGAGSTVVGQAASAGSGGSVAIGQAANAATANSIAIGQNASTGGGNIAIGFQSSAAGSDAGAFGSQTAAGGNYSTSISGRSSSSGGHASIAIGNSATVATGHNGSIVLGYSMSSTARSQLVIGNTYNDGAGYGITDVYLGTGVTYTDLSAVTINPTGASGSDLAGVNLILAGGKATGNAAGGGLLFKTSDAGSSGSTLQSLSTKMTLTNGGNLGIGTTSPFTKLSIVGNLHASNFMTDIGTNNAFIGVSVGNTSITGVGENVGVGKTVLNNITTGTRNAALGYNIMPSLTTGVGNVGIGNSVMTVATSSNGIVAIGDGALQTVRKGANAIPNLVAVGTFALQSNTYGETIRPSGMPLSIC